MMRIVDSEAHLESKDLIDSKRYSKNDFSFFKKEIRNFHDERRKQWGREKQKKRREEEKKNKR